MIDPLELHRLGTALITPADAPETAMRRGVSTLYYALFHRLAASSAEFFDQGGPSLVALVTRAVSHTTMRKVCEAYARSHMKPLPPPFDALSPGQANARLVSVAEIFNRLQEGRHRADYDIAGQFPRSEALVLLEQAEYAHWQLDEVSERSEAAVFLASLLLAGQWTRRG